MIVEQLLSALGADLVQTGAQSDERFHRDWTSASPVVPLAVVLPRCTEHVATALRLCHAAAVPVVPQGGMTGLVGGARPREDAVSINLSRMNAPPVVDKLAGIAAVQAGVTLQQLQEVADAAGYLFPVDFGARGSCQIGGAIATNAGGVHVMHYGMMRQQVLGLEVVLADGTVVDSMNALLKNNTGYDLKQWFVGSEGTLGIVTRAVLRLADRPAGRRVALARVADLDAAYALLRAARQALPSLVAFEAMWPSYYRFACQVEATAPLPVGAGLTLLLETCGPHPEGDEAAMLQVFEQAMDSGVIEDVAIAQSEAQCERFWALREANAELTQHCKRLAGFDVRIGAAHMASFVQSCEQALAALSKAAQLMCFGHLGDGNLHLVVCSDDALEIDADAVKDCVLSQVGVYGGSISAEHGIGLDKRAYLPISRHAAEIDLMLRLKRTLDPKNILNPGVIFAPG
jgi:FAD/FMN-containing dehydrogenase